MGLETITVGELIDELKNYDKNMKVYLKTHDDFYYWITMVYDDYDEEGKEDIVLMRGDQTFNC